MEFITVSQSDGIAVITLNRPEKHNAMHGPLIAELLHALKSDTIQNARVLLIQGEGENFCAGGDIAWMQKIANGTEDENYDDAQLLADLLLALYSFPHPTIVLAQGASLGGGFGLVAAADIAIATNNAVFGLPEVKMGITPSIISPYVISAIGKRRAHYYFLTGERFSAERAQDMGLVHQITPQDALKSTGLTLAQTILQNSPHALQSAKQLIRSVTNEKISALLAQKTAQHLAEIRKTKQAQEGLNAFLGKRKPNWS